ncbi:MAG TPA: hypothetical protein VFA71_00560 [Terriglobales bacterium]|nr:hypothetical protein [Terriglobales bacterium]
MRNAVRVILRALLVVVLVTLAGVTATSQESKPPLPGIPKYEPLSEVTLQGRVQEVKEYHCPISGTLGSHIAVKEEGVGAGVVEVHLAPVTFLKEYGITIKPDDLVTIVGVRVVFNGKPAMLAKTVTVQRDTYAFRNSKGAPLW